MPVRGPTACRSCRRARPDPVQRGLLAGRERIAVPGCYPTAVSLALAPGFAAGLLEPEDIVVVAASGTSGAGKGLKPHLLGSEVMGSMSPYGVGGVHRHTPEIEQNLVRAAGEPGDGVVHPDARADATRHPRHVHGPAGSRHRSRRRPAGVGAGLCRRAVRPPPARGRVARDGIGRWAATTSSSRSPSTSGSAASSSSSAVDNLTKGTAGAAVQCANIALGLDETLGLPIAGVAP